MSKRLIPYFILAFFGLAWLGFWLTGDWLAGGLNKYFGQKLMTLGDGKFSDPVVFIRGRLRDFLWLSTAATGLIWIVFALGRRWATRFLKVWRWVPYSILAAVAGEVWLRAAISTGLFWMLFWNGVGETHSEVLFRLKLASLREDKAPVKMVVLGNSQARAQVDERIINRQLAGQAWMMELHFPGIRAYELLLQDDLLPQGSTQVIVTYLSEMTFYTGASSEALPYFFGWRHLPEFYNLGGHRVPWTRMMSYGLLGDTLSYFFVRDVAAQRVLGRPITQMTTAQAAEPPDLDLRARKWLAQFRTDAAVEFEKKSFSRFAERCRQKDRWLVVCAGQLNPVMGKLIPAEIRQDFSQYLRGLAAANDHVILLDESNLPAQSTSDYEDLTHVTPAAQARFSEHLAERLRKELTLHNLPSKYPPPREASVSARAESPRTSN